MCGGGEKGCLSNTRPAVHSTSSEAQHARPSSKHSSSKKMLRPNNVLLMQPAGRRWPRASGALAWHARCRGVFGFPVRDEGRLGGRHVCPRQRRDAGGGHVARRDLVREVRRNGERWKEPGTEGDKGEGVEREVPPCQPKTLKHRATERASLAKIGSDRVRVGT